MCVHADTQVVDGAIKALNADGNGSVDYSEFVGTLFPNMAKGSKT